MSECKRVCCHGRPVAEVTEPPAVLGVSLLLEGYSLLVAVRTVTAGAASHGISFAEFVKRGMDPTSIAVMMEDGAACAGLVIAGHSTSPCAELSNSFSASVFCLRQ